LRLPAIGFNLLGYHANKDNDKATMQRELDELVEKFKKFRNHGVKTEDEAPTSSKSVVQIPEATSSKVGTAEAQTSSKPREVTTSTPKRASSSNPQEEDQSQSNSQKKKKTDSSSNEECNLNMHVSGNFNLFSF